ncbi:MAG TPA: S9 family peptidase [Pyrinomonadaceae bacterium]
MERVNSLFPGYQFQTGVAWLLACGILLSVGTAAQKNSSSQGRKIKQYPIEQFMGTETVGGNSFSFDERSILIHSNETGIFNLFSVPLTGHKARRLTSSTQESIYAVSYFPKDTRILYKHDKGGDENDHVYVRDANGREIDITPGARVKASFLGWSADGQSFFVSTNERNPQFFDIYRVNTVDYSKKILHQNDEGFLFGSISGDGKYIALYKQNSLADTDIFIYRTDSKETRHITPHRQSVWYKPQTFDAGNRFFYYLTDEGSEHHYLARFELATGRSETVERHDSEILSASFSSKGKYRAVRINEDASVRLKVYEQATGREVPLPRFPDGEISDVRFSPNQRLMSFYLTGDRSPNNLYVFDFSTRRLRRLTNTLNPNIDPADLVESRVIGYKSFDGLTIPALLFMPHQADRRNKTPALVFVHGAPGGQTRKGYKATFQYLLNHGYAILAVNQRGSQGYGKTFFAGAKRKYGREPLWDVVEGKKYLTSLDRIDPGKIGIIGESGGGYMVLAALAFSSETFAAGVDLFGVTNWIRFLESIPPQWGSIRQSLFDEFGDPVKDREMLRSTSPLFHADKIRKPLLVLQGANDARVPKVESDEIVEAVRKNGGIAEYVVFPDEGHGFSKKANEMVANKTILSFLDRHLKGRAAP